MEQAEIGRKKRVESGDRICIKKPIAWLGDKGTGNLPNKNTHKKTNDEE